MKLIPDIKKAHKYWSVRLGALTTLIATIVAAAPDALMATWATLPPDVKAYIPPEWGQIIVVVLIVSSLVARIIDQPKVTNSE
jgi:hypothetical protein